MTRMEARTSQATAHRTVTTTTRTAPLTAKPTTMTSAQATRLMAQETLLLGMVALRVVTTMIRTEVLNAGTRTAMAPMTARVLGMGVRTGGAMTTKGRWDRMRLVGCECHVMDPSSLPTSQCSEHCIDTIFVAADMNRTLTTLTANR